MYMYIVHVHVHVLQYNLYGIFLQLQNCFMKGFEVADEYAGKFELFRQFFAENETLDIQNLEQADHGW